MSEQNDAKIDTAQRDIAKERDKGDAAEFLKTQIQNNQIAFFILVDNYQDLAKNLKITNPDVLAYWEKNKTWMTDTLKNVAADGKWINDHKGALPAGSEDLQTRIKKSAEIDEIGKNFKADLDKEIQNITSVAGLIERQEQSKTAVEDFEKLEKRPDATSDELLAAAEKALFDPGIGLTTLDKATGELTNGAMDDLKAIPQAFLTYTITKIPELQEKLVNLTTTAAIEKEYSGKVKLENGIISLTDEGNTMKPEEISAMLLKLGTIRHSIEFKVVLSTAPKELEGYYLGMAAFEAGNLELAKKLLEPISKLDPKTVPTSAFDSETRFIEEAKKALDAIAVLATKNEKFFKAQELLNSGRMIEAKKLLVEYISQPEEKPGEGGQKKPDFRETARELLKKIALFQLEQFSAEFKKIIPPEKESELPAQQMADAYSGGLRDTDTFVQAQRAQKSAEYEKCKKAIDEMKKLIEGGEYEFAAIYEKVGKPNFELIGVESVGDTVTIEQKGRNGYLELARKYRTRGDFAKARQYFMMYFGEQIESDARDNFTLGQFKQEFLKDSKRYLQVAKAISDKIDEQNTALKLNGNKPLTDAEKISIHRQALDEAIASAYPQALLRYQNGRYIQAPAVMGGAGDQKIWNDEFMNMEGMHKQAEGGMKEAMAMSDAEMESLLVTIGVNVPLLFLSAGTAGAAAGMVRAGTMAVGRTAATELAAEVGYVSFGRTALAYTAGLMVENGVFTGSNMYFHSLRSQDFSTLNMDTFTREWHSGLLMLGGLGQIGKTREALKIGMGSSLALELSYMGALDGKVDLNTLATVLGLKIGHGFGKTKESKTELAADEKARVARFMSNSELTMDNLNIAEFQKFSKEAQRVIIEELSTRDRSKAKKTDTAAEKTKEGKSETKKAPQGTEGKNKSKDHEAIKKTLSPDEQKLAEAFENMDKTTLKAAEILKMFDQLIDKGEANDAGFTKLRQLAERNHWSDADKAMLEKSIKRFAEAKAESDEYKKDGNRLLTDLHLDGTGYDGLSVHVNEKFPGMVEIRLKSAADLAKFRKNFTKAGAEFMNLALGVDGRDEGWFAAQNFNPAWLGLENSKLMGISVTIDDAIKIDDPVQKENRREENLRHEYGHATLDALIRPILHDQITAIRPNLRAHALNSIIGRLSPGLQTILFDELGDVDYEGSKMNPMLKMKSLQEEQNLLDELRAFHFNLGLRPPTQRMTDLDFIEDPEGDWSNSIDPRMAQRFFEVHLLRVKAGLMSAETRDSALSIIGVSQSLSQARRLLTDLTREWKIESRENLERTFRILKSYQDSPNDINYSIGSTEYIPRATAMEKMKPPREVIDAAIKKYGGIPAGYENLYSQLYP